MGLELVTMATGQFAAQKFIQTHYLALWFHIFISKLNDANLWFTHSQKCARQFQEIIVTYSWY